MPLGAFAVSRDDFHPQSMNEEPLKTPNTRNVRALAAFIDSLKSGVSVWLTILYPSVVFCVFHGRLFRFLVETLGLTLPLETKTADLRGEGRQ